MTVFHNGSIGTSIIPLLFSCSVTCINCIIIMYVVLFAQCRERNELGQLVVKEREREREIRENILSRR